MSVASSKGSVLGSATAQGSTADVAADGDSSAFAIPSSNLIQKIIIPVSLHMCL